MVKIRDRKSKRPSDEGHAAGVTDLKADGWSEGKCRVSRYDHRSNCIYIFIYIIP